MLFNYTHVGISNCIMWFASFLNWFKSLPRWYRAEDHAEELVQYLEQMAMQSAQTLHCLDLFGASGRVARTWREAGYQSVGYDVKISRTHDICTETGFKMLLSMAARFPGLLFAPLCAALSIYPSIYLPVYLSIKFYIYLSIYLSIYPSYCRVGAAGGIL